MRCHITAIAGAYQHQVGLRMQGFMALDTTEWFAILKQGDALFQMRLGRSVCDVQSCNSIARYMVGGRCCMVPSSGLQSSFV